MDGTSRAWIREWFVSGACRERKLYKTKHCNLQYRIRRRVSYSPSIRYSHFRRSGPVVIERLAPMARRFVERAAPLLVVYK